MALTSSGSVDTRLAINDLNGDGRPDVVAAYSYYYGPHDGYQMEIWQNSTSPCVDLTQITVDAGNSSAKINLPAGVAFTDVIIEYTSAGSSNWSQAYSTTLSYLSAGWKYQVRIRAKCGLYYTSYRYINFTTECILTNGFSVNNIGVNSATVTAPASVSSYDIQYSPAGKEQWVTQTTSQITNLLPGTASRPALSGEMHLQQ